MLESYFRDTFKILGVILNFWGYCGHFGSFRNFFRHFDYLREYFCHLVLLDLVDTSIIW